METKERYGRFVLQSEDARTSAGSFWRAVQLGAAGYERHVTLFRTELLGVEVAEGVARGLQNGLQVQHAQVGKALEAGRIDLTAFAASEFIEGRSVGALLERSRSEGHPFAIDHALLIASKAAAALEAAQARKQSHGFLMPDFIQVSHDGEVSVRTFGLPSRLLKAANSVGVREASFLAPEVDSKASLDIRADIFSLGVQLFEMLTGSPLPTGQPPKKSIEEARLAVPGGDGVPLPKVLAALFVQTLSEDPGQRFKDASAFKKSVDTLLFSGDYSPTTFNLAFFMHTLFRDEGDRDADLVKAERLASYRNHVAEMNRAPAQLDATLIGPAPPVGVISPRAAEAAKSDAVRHDSGRILRAAAAPTPPLSPRGDETLLGAAPSERSFPIGPVVLGLAAVLGVGAYLLMQRFAPPAPPVAVSPAMNPAEAAALARVKELEARLLSLEAEKAAAEQKAAEEAKKMIEAQARAKGRAADPAEVQRAQDEARKKAQVDQDAKLQAERLKIDDERKKADAAKTSAGPTPEPSPSSPPASPTPSATLAQASQTPSPAPSTPVPPQGPSPQPLPSISGSPSGFLEPGDPGVTVPQVVTQSRIEYPPVARAQRLSGSVVISALVDELGNVTETRLLRGAAPNSGFNQAALENVKKRKYKPATHDGKPGKMWITIQVDFKL